MMHIAIYMYSYTSYHWHGEDKFVEGFYPVLPLLLRACCQIVDGVWQYDVKDEIVALQFLIMIHYCNAGTQINHTCFKNEASLYFFQTINVEVLHSEYSSS